MLLFVFLMVSIGEEEIIWQVEETGVFSKINRHQATVTTGGAVYLGDPGEARVMMVAEMGMVVRPFGRRGKGPGEMEHITGLYYRPGTVLVYDNGRNMIHAFDVYGKYQESWRVPIRRPDIVLTAHGWFLGDWNTVGQGEKEAALYRCDPHMENHIEIKRYSGPFYHHGARVVRARPGEAAFTPLTAKPAMAVSADGETVYVADATEFRIDVFHAADGRLLRTLMRHEPRPPMDETWVQEELESLRAEIGSQMNARLVPSAPDQFPAIRDLLFDATSGTLVIDRWRGRPDGNHHPIRLNPDGSESDLTVDWATLSRTFGVHADRTYVLDYDEEEGQTAVRAPRRKP